MTKIGSDVETFINGSAKDPMLAEVERFLQYLDSELTASYNTVAAYRNDLSQLFAYIQVLDSGLPEGSKITCWAEVTRTRIAGFIVALSGNDRRYATTTIARKIAAVKSFFHFLTARGIVLDDPTEKLDSPKVEKTLPRSLSRVEVELLLAQPSEDTSNEGMRDKSMLHLLWSTGMRVSELVSLDEADIDLASGYVRCLGKNNRERLVPLTEEARAAMAQYLQIGRRGLVGRRGESALLVNHRGERLTRQGFWLILKGYAQKAGLGKDVTPQTLRHSFALHQLDLHTDLRSLQELLGHASITTTQVYAQLAGSRSRNAAASRDAKEQQNDETLSEIASELATEASQVATEIASNSEKLSKV